MWAEPRASEWNTVVAIRGPNYKISTNDYVRVKASWPENAKPKTPSAARANQPTEFRIAWYSTDMEVGEFGTVSLEFTWP